MFFQKKKKNQLQIPPIETFKLGSRYYYARLSPNDKIWYRQIYDAWLTGASEAHLSMPGTDFVTPDGTPFLDLVLAVVEDNPHLFHVERSHFHYTRTGNQVNIVSNNIYTPQEFRQKYQQLWQRIGQILAAAKKYKTKIEQLRFLHDYLAASITYDYCEEDEKMQREAHTMVGALLNRRCVCDGYARAFRMLCDRLGISCIVVIGEGPKDNNPGGHAWNMVKLDQIPYHIDVTWDSNYTVDGIVKDFEFMCSDDSAARRHIWDTNMYPKCPRDWPRREKLVSNYANLEAELVRHLKNKHKIFLLWLDGTLVDENAFHTALRQVYDAHSKLLPSKGSFYTRFYPIYNYRLFYYVSDDENS